MASAQQGGGSCCPKSRDTSGSLVCSTIKSALVGSGATTLISPDLHPLYTLVPFALALDAMATEPTTAFFAKPLCLIGSSRLKCRSARRTAAKLRPSSVKLMACARVRG